MGTESLQKRLFSGGFHILHHRMLSAAASQAVTSPPSPQTSIEDNPEVVKQPCFEKVQEQFLDEYKSTAILYRHKKKTGAELMSVTNEDENKVFGIVFRTPPQDSTGIPHILEHSVLCRSRKYSLKEPFVELLKGSLHTFLNAFTYPDRTCCPVASTNTKDFYNLVDVYLDAVFFPKCVNDKQIFQQEGWHHELNEISEEITLKGVVFNEMKGVYSQPDNLLGRVSQQALFPDNTYGVDSGGDPAEFHRKFYHPSNARIWFYGDDDPNERLCLISAYLDEFEENEAARESKVKVQNLFTEPRTVTETYAAGETGDLKKKHIVCVNWVLADTPLDMETELAIGFLDHLMLGTPAAPLRKALLESGFGEAIVGGGVDDDLLQPQFSLGLKNVSEENVLKVEELIMAKLKELVDVGFTSEAMEASMNTIEFSLRENNTGSFPRGLSLMLHAMGNWLYGRDPFEPLRFAKPLEQLKDRIAAEGPKAPDTDKGAVIENEEKELLKKLKESMTKEDLAELVRATEELRLKQETPDPPEALATVPCLSLDDIPKEPIRVPMDIGDIKGTTVLRHDLFTNDVLYADLAFDMSYIDAELLPLILLFCQLVMEMGTKDMDFVQLNQLVGQKTGGISIYPSTTSKRGKKEPCSNIIVRGKAMASQIQDLFELMRILLQDVQFTDQQRFKQFVSQSKAKMVNALRGHGHSIAAARMDAKMNIAGWVSEQMGGLSYFDFLQNLERQVDNDWSSVSASLEKIRLSFLCSQGLVVPTQVNYVGKAYNIYDTGYELNGHAYVISKYISNTWLWDRVRVSGGAYGGFCDFDSHSGVFSYLSYRDPNLLETLEIYVKTPEFLRGLELDQDSLSKAIIGRIGDVDAYQLPDVKGYTSMIRYQLGITEEERKQRREEIMSTKLKDFKEFANVLEAASKSKSVAVVVASEDDIVAANKRSPGLFELKKIL
ncbi:hypothetical protein KP509_12G014200 [Ceratopteris richardii]|uniref:Peptidase M16C associated domain-containing protein n=1 Tax=Ceratopteris richardii TaxID=49495 RepID=A0A8T2TLF0_CERRI|nr:hypothetical protein KP509_12G014200 [Ceratopteris richardii]